MDLLIFLRVYNQLLNRVCVFCEGENLDFFSRTGSGGGQVGFLVGLRETKGDLMEG